MKKCIIEYHEKEYKCYCGELRECKDCSIESNRKDDKCIVTLNGYCTCRECGRAVRSDGYCYKESNL